MNTLPDIIIKEGVAYYVVGELRVPVEACSCRARWRDSQCAVPSHRREAARQWSGRRKDNPQRPPPRAFLERRLKASRAPPVILCGVTVTATELF